jgi:2-dehydro-3-deoxyglucarate aldolase
LSAVFIGTADLAVSMGYLHDLANPAVLQAVTAIAEACRGHQVPFGLFTANEQAAATWITRGAQIVTMGSDLGYLDAGIAQTRQARAALLSRPDGAAPTVSSHSPRH